ncbi:hypothetical protein Leryth_003248 [Lithospermum erythrorhizon]|nr:hypothetical protein Leryth_003248 [Lithospermum erythrorhizon]
MEILISTFFQILSLCLVAQHLVVAQEVKTGDAKSNQDIYIVHVSKPLEDTSTLSNDDLESWYSSFLPKSTISTRAQSRLLHSYRHVISGFAAKLTADEVKEMENRDGFISAMKENVYSLHTTHTPSFLGLQQNLGLWQDSNYGEGIIIGFLDGGITPDHPSFNDDGMHPPPTKWKGKCEGGIVCNNKLIGARNFANASEPAIDVEGHGTHTSSTAAGNFVSNANVFGQANGTASGMAPRAHVAIYKVCSGDCPFSAILAGMDAAIEDGVDVISYSLGAGSLPFHADPLTIAAYSAIQKGIIVSASAGNGGPSSGRLSNESPWLLTVGASTIDRNFRATITLGNSETFDGQSIFQPDFPSTLLPLVYPIAKGDNSSYCDPGSLDFSDVKGKIVVCLLAGKTGGVVKGQTVKDAGGAAMIIINTEVQGYCIVPDIHVLPTAHVSYYASQKILAYLNSTSNATGALSFKGTIIGDKDAPSVTHFSSRGPSIESPGILKPDIVAPGVGILAAWPRSVEGNNNTKSTFNIIAGTSMSTPHLSGIAAILKKSHPDWSSAAIKSAIMTTADSFDLNNQPIMDERMQPANVFALGAGHVNPPKANNPSLVCGHPGRAAFPCL